MKDWTLLDSGWLTDGFAWVPPDHPKRQEIDADVLAGEAQIIAQQPQNTPPPPTDSEMVYALIKGDAIKVAEYKAALEAAGK